MKGVDPFGIIGGIVLVIGGVLLMVFGVSFLVIFIGGVIVAFGLAILLSLKKQEFVEKIISSKKV